ncbi:MAG: NADH-quinone oxidoreductase subunit J [Candidatus Schekmanbacteria bacterium]|nr:MAG: NADH-quinone oxidoreductase subunit J [Candidatus Schekmanbacteria bacterium]
METVGFYFCASLAVVSAVFMVLKKNPVASVFSLIITFISLAGLYVTLYAHFLAIIQILVYAGAIMVLFLFVVMLLDLREDEIFFKVQKGVKIGGIFLVGILLAEVWFVASSISKNILSKGNFTPDAIAREGGNTMLLGKLLFTKYLLPFELTSVLLLVAIIGAVLMSRRTGR